MEIVIGVVVIAVLFFVFTAVRSNGIVKRHAQTFSKLTGIPADTIKDEMLRNRLTPGQWAMQHGLDPVTFGPVHNESAEAMLDQAWAGVRLDQQASRPSTQILQQILSLQDEFAYSLTSNPPLLAEANRQSEILRELHALGAHIDASYVNPKYESFGIDGGEFNGAQTQQAYDDWQRKVVADD